MSSVALTLLTGCFLVRKSRSLVGTRARPFLFKSGMSLMTNDAHKLPLEFTDSYLLSLVAPDPHIFEQENTDP